jgi:hypothetical protein
MSRADPFATLGLGPGATVEDVRAARRRLAIAHHPDQGGDPDVMQAVNEAADAALLVIEERASTMNDRAEPSDVGTVRSDPGRGEREPTGVARDMPSFTVEALPVETFEAMLVVASWLGEVLDDDPPYRLDTYLYEPFDCWCRLDVVPDAGASTVSLDGRRHRWCADPGCDHRSRRLGGQPQRGRLADARGLEGGATRDRVTSGVARQPW